MEKAKYFIVALVLAVTGFCATAATTTGEDVDNYKASMMSFIRSEGYVPKIDSDGDIEFKHDGDAYWAQVSAFDDGYYVTVATYTGVDGYDRCKVCKTMDLTMADLKFVRLYTTADHSQVKVSYNWYCVSIADFKRMFDTALSVVSAADSKLIKGLLAD